jgi:expansin
MRLCRARGLLALASVVGLCSCQRILGIHGAGSVGDAAVHADAVADVVSPPDQTAPDGPAGGDAAGADKPTDAGGDGGVDSADDPVAPAKDAPVEERDGASATDAAGDGGLVDAVADVATDKVSDGGPSDGAGPPDGGGSDAAVCAPAWHAENVEARLLTPGTAATACSVAAADIPALAAAVDATTFRGAQACGACIRVQGTLNANAVTVPIVERSGAAGILLTRAAMDQIAPGGSLIAVDWRLVACDTKNLPLRFYIKEGSNAGYVGIQVRNSRYPLASVSAVGTSTSLALTLQSYNYWESTAAGAGPLTLRVVDVNGQSVQEPGVKIVPQTETVGQGQFPVCR